MQGLSSQACLAHTCEAEVEVVTFDDCLPKSTLHVGIVPTINASIVLQLLSTTFPSLKKLQREEGPQVITSPAVQLLQLMVGDLSETRAHCELN